MDRKCITGNILYREYERAILSINYINEKLQNWLIFCAHRHTGNQLYVCVHLCFSKISHEPLIQSSLAISRFTFCGFTVLRIF